MDNWPDFTEAYQPTTEMTDGEKAVRDQFVTEFLKDRNSYLAAIRCGFIGTFAIEYAKRFMGEPYVQCLIDELSTPDPDEEIQTKLDFERNAQRLRQIRDDPASKPLEVKAAIAELNAMRGFNKPTGNEGGEEALINAMREFAAKAPV